MVTTQRCETPGNTSPFISERLGFQIMVSHASIELTPDIAAGYIRLYTFQKQAFHTIRIHVILAGVAFEGTVFEKFNSNIGPLHREGPLPTKSPYFKNDTFP